MIIMSDFNIDILYIMSKRSNKFNKLLKECIQNIDIINNKNRKYNFETENDYLKSVNKNVKSFSMTVKEKKSIDCIVYNEKNNDGTFSAAIVYHYLKENNVEPTLIRIGAGPDGIYKNKSLLKDKTVLF